MGGRFRLMICAAALWAPLTLSQAAHADGLSWPASYQSAAAIPLQSGANDATLSSTACWSSGSCLSVGEDDVSGGERAIVVPEIDGLPGGAQVVTLPSGAKTGSSAAADLNGVSCSATGACVAVGEYLDSSGVTDALVVPITLGVVGTGVEVSPPGASGQSYLRAVSCPPSGACAAVGTYGIDANAGQEGVVVPVDDGVPGTPVQISAPVDADTSAPSVWVNAVSCWSDGACVAAGQYQTQASDGAIAPMVVPISGGAPSGAAEVTLPTDAQTGAGQQALLTSVSCTSAGSCVAAGSYVDNSSGSEPLVVSVNGDAAAPAGQVAEPEDNGGPRSDAALSAVSCPATAGQCAAVGYYADTAGSQEPLVISIAAGAAASALPVTLPAGALAASSGDQDATLASVNCPLSGSCLAVGDYYDGSENEQALALPISGSSLAANAAGTPVPANADPYASLNAVGCGSAGSCVADGEYDDPTPQAQGFDYSLQATLTISTTTLPVPALGATYTAMLGAAGAWGAYTWSVIAGSLPAGLSLDAQTGVISGTPTTAGSHSFTIEATGTGQPAQTTTAELSLTVASLAHAASRAKPAVKLSIGRAGLKLEGNHVSVHIACSKAACRGSLKLVYAHEVTLSHHRRRRENTVIGQVGYSLAAGRARTLTVKLTRAGLNFLKHAKHHRLGIVVDATVKGGRSISARTTVFAAAASRRSLRPPDLVRRR